MRQSLLDHLRSLKQQLQELEEELDDFLKQHLLFADKAKLLLTTPASFFGQREADNLARDLSRYEGTLVFYMGLRGFENLVNSLRKFYPADLPVAVVYYAGHQEKEKVIKGTLSDILAKTSSETEKWWGLIIVGRCLTGPSFTPGE